MKTLRQILRLIGALIIASGSHVALAQAIGNNGMVQGPVASGASVAGNPVLTGGSDGTHVRSFKIDSSGQLYIANPGGTGSTKVTDSTSAYYLAINSAGQLYIANWPSTQAVTGSFYQATQPVSIASLPALTAGSAVIGHTINDTGSTTAVTALPAIPAGTNVIGHVIADTGSTTTVTALPAIPAGTNVIGHVIVDTAPTTAVTAASLPLPTGAATAAKQPALGTAGSPSSDVITVQGNSSGTPIPISGSITVSNPSVGTTGSSIPASTTMIGGTDGTNLRAIFVDTSGRPIVNINGTPTVTANAGSGTFAVSALTLPLPTNAAQETGGNLASIVSNTAPLGYAQGSTSAGQLGAIAQTTTTTSAPTYVTAKTNPLSTDTSGNLRTSVNNTVTVATHAVTQSGTWTNQLSDGTTTANIAPASGSQTGQAGIEVAQTWQSQTFSFTSATTGTSYDLGSYRTVSVQIAGAGGANTITFQTSNDNSTWVTFGLLGSNVGSGSIATTSASTGMFWGQIPGRYFRLNCTAYVSGTSSGTIYFSTGSSSSNTMGVMAGQSGTWTVQPGNTANTTPWLTTNTASASGGYTYSHLAANGTTTIKSGAGTLHSITVGTQGATDTITVYDNTAGSGTVISVINDGSVSANSLVYDCAFSTGLTVLIAGTTPPDVTVMYK